MPFFGYHFYGSTTAAPAPTGGKRDRDAYAAIKAALEATGQFERVFIGTPDAQAEVPSDYATYANVQEAEGDTAPDSANPRRKIRTGRYVLTIGTRAMDKYEGEATLDLLDSIVRNAIENKDYGFCISKLSMLGTGKHDTSRTPNVSMTYNGQFVYPVTTAAGFDTTP